MTEPDEALLWARENSPPHIYVELANAAHAYRAGAAASEARIKELEEALAFIAAMETERSNATVRRMARVANAALLKEADL